MWILYTIVIVVIGGIALVGTLIAGKQVNQTIKSMEEMDPNEQTKPVRAHHFKDEKKNLSVLVWIYVLAFLGAIVAATLYMMFR